MRFKEGTRVEVFRKKMEPCGSWIPARILSKDRCKYTVRYELLLTSEGQTIEVKVHGKDVRPCPPHVDGENWGVGDVAEVFDLHSWKVGKIAKVLQNKLYIVRLCVSVQVKKFHISDMRIRQAWHDDQWIMLGKGDENVQQYGSSKGRTYLESEADNIKYEAHNTCRYEQDYDSSLCGAKMVKGNKKRRRLTAEVQENDHLTQDLLPRKVDSVPFTKDLVWTQCAAESIECSVASCSSEGLAENSNQNTGTHPRAVAGGSFKETKWSCPSKSKDELAANIHELELHAYKTTMRALFVSGFLSWEQESLLTNLRLSLHISNEEHLHQLRHLLSS